MNWADFSQADLERWCPSRILERGQACYHEGHLLKACRFENVLAGKFQGGSGIYEAVLRLEEGKALWECNCPYPDFCKHLAALAYAWLNNPAMFEVLDGLYRQVVDDTVMRERVMHELVAKGPFRFLDVCRGQSEHGFASNRVILNIVRSLFKYPQLKMGDVENLWERLQGLVPLLEGEIAKGEPGVLTPLKEVWEALVAAYRDSLDPGLKELLLQQLQLQRALPRFFPTERLQPFLQRLISGYFDTFLWELGEAIRPVLREYLEANPRWLAPVLEALNGREGYLHWIRGYELSEAVPALHGQLPVIAERLQLSREGRLWLIDRWAAERPAEAYRLAKRSLAECRGKERWPFRDRLIEMHRLRLELKQAAALSYVQLTESLDFEEYVRLKHLLQDYPEDFQGYLRRLACELRQRKAWLLLGRIMMDAGRYRDFMGFLPEVLADKDALFGMVDVLADWKEPAILGYPIYPAVLLAAVDGSPRRQANPILRAIAAYKKLCLRNGNRDLWEAFVSEAKSRLDGRILGRWGALLE